MTNITNLSNDSKSRYGLIFDMAMDGILLLSHPEGRVEEANPAILRQLGFSREELIGRVGIWPAQHDSNVRPIP